MSTAILYGTLDDDGGENCTCGFQWGITIAFGHTTATQSLATGGIITQPLTGLANNTTYYYRAFATNSVSTTYGATLSFTTPYAGGGSTPEDIIRLNAKVQTLSPTNIDSHAATMRGYVENALGYYGNVFFEYGADRSYGNRTASAAAYTTGDSFESRIGLGEGRAYHYRAVLEIRGVRVYGSDATINTPSALGPVTFIGGDIFPDEDL